MSERSGSEQNALIALVVVIVGAVLASFFSAIERIQMAVAQAGGGKTIQTAWWADTLPQWAMAVFTALGTIVALLGLRWIVQTFRETQKAVQAANDANLIASLDQRPWMDIRPPSVALTLKDGVVLAHVYAVAQNVGRTVATGIVFTVEIVDLNRVQNLGSPRDRVFKGGEALASDSLFGSAAFPGGSAGVSRIVHTPLEADDYVRAGWSRIAVFLCCTYRLQNGRLGKTGRVYTLVERDQQSLSFEPLDRFDWQFLLGSADYGSLALTE